MLSGQSKTIIYKAPFGCVSGLYLNCGNFLKSLVNIEALTSLLINGSSSFRNLAENHSAQQYASTQHTSRIQKNKGLNGSESSIFNIAKSLLLAIIMD